MLRFRWSVIIRKPCMSARINHVGYRLFATGYLQKIAQNMISLATLNVKPLIDLGG
ncbi:hypothetical protein GCM10007876_26200 [Litoribrevibacter albus]|uniref:Uncharacterized protein n=1 Tax=Litoribrevibacter albus TaxID=1473156 RepID=A0AA37W912_9GAMM|nr:hypothetical protein GCM10007876_26200 [Litoribrevibacter albus]